MPKHKQPPTATPPIDPKRKALLAALATMPDEAFGWFVAWCMGGFPDGLGGFRPESRTSITALRAAASKYADGMR